MAPRRVRRALAGPHGGRDLELGGAGTGPAPADSRQRRTVSATDDAQVLVPAGHWQRTVATDHDALVSCLVSPGFDFEDFELAT